MTTHLQIFFQTNTLHENKSDFQKLNLGTRCTKARSMLSVIRYCCKKLALFDYVRQKLTISLLGLIMNDLNSIGKNLMKTLLVL